MRIQAVDTMLSLLRQRLSGMASRLTWRSFRRTGFPLGVLVVSIVWWMLYLSAEYLWIADAAMGWGIHIAFVLCVSGVVMIFTRRSRISGLAFFMCITIAWAFMHDRHLMPRNAGRHEQSLEVVSLNLSMGNRFPDELFKMIEGLECDVVVLVEPRWEVLTAITGDRDPFEHFPYRVFRRRHGEVTPPMVILSHWPIDRDPEVEEWVGISVVVHGDETVGGSFRLVGVHADSPRGGDRWRRGNGVIHGIVEQVGGIDDGLPLVVAGDINGGPISFRDRVLRSGLGVRRASSLFDLRSTYPSNVSMFGVLIDDIWVSKGVTPVLWDTVEIPGSDHHGVRVRLRINGTETGDRDE